VKTCSKCKLEKELQEFNKNIKKPDGLQNICRECSNKKSAAHYLNNKQSYRDSKKNSIQTLKQFIFEYLSTHSCIDCPESDPVTLEFDHVNGIKSRNISDMIHAGVSLESLKLELEKCVVRCANCHRKKTAKDFGWYKLAIT
jgi:5-methylcytosine-specific restriction endonuclease McrA